MVYLNQNAASESATEPRCLDQLRGPSRTPCGQPLGTGQRKWCPWLPSAVSEHECSGLDKDCLEFSLQRLFIVTLIDFGTPLVGVSPHAVCECCSRRFVVDATLPSLKDRRNYNLAPASQEDSLFWQTSNSKMAAPLASPNGPGGLLHNYGINYNMLETILPNYGLIRRILSRKVGIDISSILGVAFIGLTLTQTCTTVWRHVKNLALGCASWVTSSISLSEHDPFTKDIGVWVVEHLGQGNTRHLSATSSEHGLSEEEILMDDGEYYPIRKSAQPIPSREPDQFDGDKSPITYLPAMETSNWFWFQGAMIILRYEQPEHYAGTDPTLNLHASRRTPLQGPRLVLTCLGWSTAPLKNFMQCCKDFAAESKVSTTTIYRFLSIRKMMGWDHGMSRPSRPLSTVDLDPNEKQGLVDDITSYLGARQFYARRGIPYRRGYLFHGPPVRFTWSSLMYLVIYDTLEINAEL